MNISTNATPAEEGWDVLSINAKDSEFQIQKDEDSDVFPDDESAILHVIHHAKAGNQRCVNAIKQCMGDELVQKLVNQSGYSI